MNTPTLPEGLEGFSLTNYIRPCLSDHDRTYSTSIPPTSTADSVESLGAGRCEMRASAMGLL